MIVLDTNVISEAMKPMPHPEVRAWLNDQAIETLYLSSVTMAELLFGIEAMSIWQSKQNRQGLDFLPQMVISLQSPLPVDSSWPHETSAPTALLVYLLSIRGKFKQKILRYCLFKDFAF
jgi:hypothetical protein